MEMELEPPPPLSATASMLAAAELAEEPSMAMVRTIRNDNVVHHLLPAGFEPCQSGHVCPNCRSTLIVKPSSVETGGKKAKDGGFLADEAALSGDVDLNAVVEGNLKSSLESARSANLLLQALSFDASTRYDRRGLENEQIAEGISYCPDCRVHVITSAEELELLFDKYDKEGDDDMEWLRGSLLVTVDDAEVVALENRRKAPLIDQELSYSKSGLSRAPSQSEVISAHDTLPRHLQPKPMRPQEFDYDYRHKVATHSMASRIQRGYTLLDEVCPECEMPLMKARKSKEKECVVCPKLLKKIAKYKSVTAEGDPNAVVKRPEVDPISAIIAEARQEAPHQYGRTRRTVRPDVAEAKQYVMQRRIMSGGPNKPKDHEKRVEDFRLAAQSGGCNMSEAGSNGTESITAASSTEDRANNVPPNPINWEELLVNGRTILSKRLTEGWTLSRTNCAGTNCKGTPLLHRSDVEQDVELDYCVVCGGTGNGEDGAYEREAEWRATAAEMAERAEREARPDWEELVGNGRAMLAERLKQGWTMSSENCSGYHCGETPLTNFEGGPDSCVVCGGSGNGEDGAYENYKPDEVVDEERELVSREISQLLSMGWVLREALCARCLMPLVAEDDSADDQLCILCGRLPENNPHCEGLEEEDVEDSRDSYLNGYDEEEEEPYVMDALTQAVNEPVAIPGDDNTDEAGKRLIMGWTLPDAGLCYHCHGVLMSPPSSKEIGCINRGCSSALAAAYTFMDPYASTGPVKLIGRGFSKPNKEEEEVNDAKAEEEAAGGQMMENKAQQGTAQRLGYDGPPLEVVGDTQGSATSDSYDEPSVLSDDLSQVRSVASSALGIILVRLDDAKYELQTMRESGDADPKECARKQMEITMLIEKLAAAAVQMKQREG